MSSVGRVEKGEGTGEEGETAEDEAGEEDIC